MRTTSLLAVLFCILALAPVRADEVKPGDDRATIVAKLGKPTGKMMLGGREILNYGRGYVQLVNGTATVVKIVSPEEAMYIQRQRHEQARLRGEEQAAREQAMQEARDTVLNDEGFKTNAPADRLKALDQLRQEHPNVDVSEAYQQAQAEEKKALEEEQAALKKKADEEPKPKLSASKRRKMKRAVDENETAAPGGY